MLCKTRELRCCKIVNNNRRVTITILADASNDCSNETISAIIIAIRAPPFDDYNDSLRVKQADGFTHPVSTVECFYIILITVIFLCVPTMVRLSKEKKTVYIRFTREHAITNRYSAQYCSVSILHTYNTPVIIVYGYMLI